MEIKMPVHPELEAYPVDREDLRKRRMDTETEQKDAEFSARVQEHEQSHTSKLLEHHLKLQQLERKVVYLQAELDAMEARRDALRKTLLIFGTGVLYGLVLIWIFSE